MNEAVGIDRHTIERWRTWWRDGLTATPFWQTARAALMPPVGRIAKTGDGYRLAGG